MEVTIAPTQKSNSLTTNTISWDLCIRPITVVEETNSNADIGAGSYQQGIPNIWTASQVQLQYDVSAYTGQTADLKLRLMRADPVLSSKEDNNIYIAGHDILYPAPFHIFTPEELTGTFQSASEVIIPDTPGVVFEYDYPITDIVLGSTLVFSLGYWGHISEVAPPWGGGTGVPSFSGAYFNKSILTYELVLVLPDPPPKKGNVLFNAFSL